MISFATHGLVLNTRRSDAQKHTYNNNKGVPKTNAAAIAIAIVSVKSININALKLIKATKSSIYAVFRWRIASGGDKIRREASSQGVISYL